jgi:hypothetical protein
VYLKIYVFVVLPSQHQCSDDERQININYLIEDFKSKNHDDVNDPEVLSLYALPYVTSPNQHPVFSKFFKVHSFTTKLHFAFGLKHVLITLEKLDRKFTKVSQKVCHKSM